MKNAGDQDDGTWHFQVGYGNNREEMQWYQHSVVVQVKSKFNIQNMCLFRKVFSCFVMNLKDQKLYKFQIFY